jgi:hypothetical protein
MVETMILLLLRMVAYQQHSAVTIKLLPVAAITGANSICENANLNLVATDAGIGATYAWADRMLSLQHLQTSLSIM